MPLNDITQLFQYNNADKTGNQRIIVSAPIKQPNAWYISKLENLHPIGINKITLSQTKFDENKDISYIASDGRTHWLADGNSSVEISKPDYDKKSNDYSSISCAVKQLKINGGYRKLTANFYNENGELIDNHLIDDSCWKFTIDDVDISDIINVIYDEDNYNIVKVKFLGDKTYLNQIVVVTISDINEECQSTLELEITSL